MTALIGMLAARLGVPDRLRGVFTGFVGLLSVLAIAALVALAVTVWIGKRERHAVNADRTAANAQASGQALAADRQAGAAKDQRDRKDRADQDNLKEKTDAAARAGTSPLDALFDGLR